MLHRCTSIFGLPRIMPARARYASVFVPRGATYASVFGLPSAYLVLHSLSILGRIKVRANVELLYFTFYSFHFSLVRLMGSIYGVFFYKEITSAFGLKVSLKIWS